MKGEVTLRVLESITGFAGRAANIVEVILSSGYGASIGTLERNLTRLERRRAYEHLQEEEKALLQKRFSTMLYRLQKDGLTENIERRRGRFALPQLTAKGRKVLLELKKRRENRLPSAHYDATPQHQSIIVAFDIPESEKRKRAWLRAALKHMEFRMVQKSFWIGRKKIPHEFLEDLRVLKLARFVEIFEVNRAGTLE